MSRLLPILLLLPTGCTTLAGAWRDLPPVSRPPADILHLIRDVMDREGYTVETETATPPSILLTSKWKEQLSPHWRQGKRRRVEVQVDARDGGSAVKLRTYLQYNDNYTRSGSSSEATWISEGGGDGDVELRMYEMIRMRLARPEP